MRTPQSAPLRHTPVLSATDSAVEPFASSLAHLRAELERMDLLFRIHVLRARQVSGDDAFRGLVISDPEVDALFTRPIGSPHWTLIADPPELLRLEQQLQSRTEALSKRCAETLRQGTPLRLLLMMDRLRLSRFEVEVLLLGMAPELDVRYERLFGYLHDDVTRRRPSVDLALGLLCPSFEDRLAARASFSLASPLLRHRLLRLLSEASHPSPTLLGSAYKVDSRIVEWLLGSDDVDARLMGRAWPVEPEAASGQGAEEGPIEELLRELTKDGARAAAEGWLIHLHGPPGSGKQAAADMLCAAMGKQRFFLEGASLKGLEAAEAEDMLRLALREAVLRDAVLYWHAADGLLGGEGGTPRAALRRALEEHRGPVLLATEEPWLSLEPLRHRRLVRVELKAPEPRLRARLWQAELAGAATLNPTSPAAVSPGMSPKLEPILRLASRYRFTAGQIRKAAALAREQARTRDPAHAVVTVADVSEACRQLSGRALSSFARRVHVPSGWDDLVLPEAQMKRLREICDHARYREQVYEDWGFGRKLATGKGLCLLFTGPPGTGKTMTAGIMAGELGLDLYQIDLSALVSKYIGETEKQIARVFAEAEGTGAVLFFDEADALFGKRSEVRDSHDRYANQETSYLLQRIEAYEGMVVLATNFSRNLDDAFLRRFHFIVEFNNPEEQERRRIWERIWPAAVPRAPDLDLGFMARRFELSGGHIRNIAVAAAFLAAAQGGEVTMKDLLHAARREYQKLGRRLDEALFQHRV